VGKADLILICPATANTISKIACGIDDTPVTTVATTSFGSSIPIVIVPAMHESMYKHPILQENERKLKECGIDILGPRISEGKAKIARIDDIIDRVIDILVLEKDYQDKRVLITAGPTREAIDSVRFVSNKSSGKMGIEIAKEAAARGAKVLLIAGKCNVKLPEYIETIHVVSTDDFITAVKNEISIKSYDFFISAAAISDYKPTKCIEGKISSDNIEEIHLNMKLTPKIINVARKKDYNLFIVAFKAEINKSRTELINKAYDRLVKSDVDLIVANDIGRDDIGFTSKYNEVYIINKRKHVTHVERNTKRYIASKILDVALEAYRAKEI
ncbi:MAG: bifunctional phosphopantothenoylcysteine decarboxylase/phosphopantothenate--cysteine ligase CoaBC, partial [Candidatus Lokiarchaeota archaeon]|nr:bifunctional phosphopantothenoylcysteine decarboxylase/phosphopantothenate--cysteine ligase CoaBC [Candidatus Lokiarchaeota archaeon]